MIPFEQPNTTERMLEYGPTGRVPVLKHGGRTIWDSLAICEYINELVPEAKLWPTETEARSVARSVASEMHSGGGRAISFTFDTNIRRRTKQITPTQDVNKNIERILVRNIRTKELLTVKPIKIAVFETITIIGSVYSKIRITSTMNKLLLFSDWVIASENKNWIRPMPVDHNTIAMRC